MPFQIRTPKGHHLPFFITFSNYFFNRDIDWQDFCVPKISRRGLSAAMSSFLALHPGAIDIGCDAQNALSSWDRTRLWSPLEENSIQFSAATARAAAEAMSALEATAAAAADPSKGAGQTFQRG